MDEKLQSTIQNGMFRGSIVLTTFVENVMILYMEDFESAIDVVFANLKKEFLNEARKGKCLE